MAAFDAPALAALHRGLEHLRARDYFAAHDDWEEVWQDLSGHRRMFWQAMIQLAVGGYHFTNGNLRGCLGLWQKALQKCEDLQQQYDPVAPEPVRHLHTMLAQGLALVERGEDPLAHLHTFATTVVSETWFHLV
jgi:predicted metal-dependent hydrolase